MNKIIQYSAIYTTGVLISASYVLYTNDIYYNTIFRRLNVLTGEKSDIWEEIKPREIFGVGARATFINHKIDNPLFEDTNMYHDHLSRKKQDSANDYDEILDKSQNLHAKNIFNKKK